jgi:hypothetical protein
MDMDRMRGFGPDGVLSDERSDGHFQIARLFPQYFHIGLLRMPTSGSQFARFWGLKSRIPVTHAPE